LGAITSELSTAASPLLAYLPHEVLFHQEAPCHRQVFLIRQGLVGTFWGGRRQGKRYLEILGPGDPLGAECRCNEAWACQAQTLTQVEGWWLKEEGWLALLRQRGLLERFRQRRMDQLRRFYAWGELLAYGSVRARVAWRLLDLAERFGRDAGGRVFVPLHMTQERCAELVGATRPVVARALQYFQEQGWVILGQEGFEVSDRKALKEQSLEG